MCHPAYPSAAALRREAASEARDLADLVALRELRCIVADTVGCAKDIGPIRHPDRRWTTEDLLESLAEHLADIDATAAIIRRGPLVLEDAA
jgi:hypothetical protein